MCFRDFNEKILNFQSSIIFPVEKRDSSLFHAYSWVLWKNREISKFTLFPSSDERFKSFSCAYMIFHENISNFQSSLSSYLRCEIHFFSCAFINFHEIILKVLYLKFMIFHENISNFQSLLIPIWDVRFKSFSCAFASLMKKF